MDGRPLLEPVRGTHAEGAEAPFPDDASPVNLFPVLLNAEFGTSYPTWPNERHSWGDISATGVEAP